jgi:predicted alpha/beta superfamily hydrolase
VSLVEIPDTDSWTFTSAHTGVEHRIDIALPTDLDHRLSRAGSESGSPAYPVVVVLDGNVTFPLVYATMRMLTMHGEAEEVLIVGMSYPGIKGMRDAMAVRTRDLTPTETSWWDDVFIHHATPEAPLPDYLGSGGGRRFLDCITQEVLPAVHERYPTDPTRVTLLGHSFGGLFGLETLFTRPESFSHYLIGSPSVWWDGQVILRHEEESAVAREDLPANVFLAVGGGEPDFMLSDMYAVAQRLRSHDYPGLSLTTHVVPDQSHKASVPSFVLTGLRHVHGRVHVHR